MNLYTADLLIRERAKDRQRDFEAAQLLALAKPPRDGSPGWRQRVSRIAGLNRIAGWYRVMRRGAAT